MKAAPRNERVRDTARREVTKVEPKLHVPHIRPMTDTEFFRENILPLSTFLDEHAVVTEEALVLVQTFVLQFVDDYTWPEVTLLLRSIGNRKDAWSQQVIETGGILYQQINDYFQQGTGARLDMA
jgi:hypothetical protein